MTSDKELLIKKYNIPGPRYTSYPTVPYWNPASFSVSKWEENLKKEFAEKNAVSLYIHLPYCESLCTYCGCNTRITVNHKVEKPYIDLLLKEWELYTSFMTVKPVIKELHLGGGTPTFFSPENLERLIEGIRQAVDIADDAEMGFEGHPNNTTEEHLKTLYKVGFRRVSFGIQDFDSKVQQAINRIQPYENVERVTAYARNIGYTSINFDLIYGLPFQMQKGLEETIDKVIQLKPDRIAFYSYAHVPWMKPGQRSYSEKDLPDDEAKRNLYERGKDKLERAGYYEIGMDHFAFSSDPLYKAAIQKRLGRNFMGYTTQKTSVLIGLGVSAINDTGNAFAQNAKTVEEYSQQITKGELALIKGHFLSNEDLILRRHILNIMCGLKTSWVGSKDQCAALFSGIGRMAGMENDGLVKIGFSSLQVTDKGKPFIRNICMALDAKLHQESKSNFQFSKTI